MTDWILLFFLSTKHSKHKDDIIYFNIKLVFSESHNAHLYPQQKVDYYAKITHTHTKRIRNLFHHTSNYGSDGTSR